MRILIKSSLTPRSLRARRSARLAVQPRAGVSIIELIFAIILLAVGMLALAGVSVAVMGQVRGAASQTVAAAMIQSRFEPLDRRPCGAIVAGSQTYRGIDEVWVTSVVAARAKAVRDTVHFPGLRNKKSVAVSTVVACD